MSLPSSARMPLRPKEKAMEALHNPGLQLPARFLLKFTKEAVTVLAGHLLVFAGMPGHAAACLCDH